MTTNQKEEESFVIESVLNIDFLVFNLSKLLQKRNFKVKLKNEYNTKITKVF